MRRSNRALTRQSSRRMPGGAARQAAPTPPRPRSRARPAPARARRGPSRCGSAPARP